MVKHYLPEILDKILGDIFLCLRKASFDQKWNVIGLLFPEIEVLGIYEISRKSLKYLELKALPWPCWPSKMYIITVTQKIVKISSKTLKHRHKT